MIWGLDLALWIEWFGLGGLGKEEVNEHYGFQFRMEKGLGQSEFSAGAGHEGDYMRIQRTSRRYSMDTEYTARLGR